MPTNLWDTILYTPLLNALIGLYNTIGFESLSLAVFWLTVIIRLVLLPFSFIEERNRGRYHDVAEKWKKLEKDIPSDVVLRRELLRKYLKEKRVSPWARIASMGLQLLVLVLLYQVFMGGFRSPETFPLYGFVQRPFLVNTSFFGLFDIAQHNAPSAAVVALFLFGVIWIEQRDRKEILTRSNLYYRIFFPVFTFFALWALPSVKAVFIGTSMVFTQILRGVRLLIQHFYDKEKKAKEAGAPKLIAVPEGNPWEALKKIK